MEGLRVVELGAGIGRWGRQRRRRRHCRLLPAGGLARRQASWQGPGLCTQHPCKVQQPGATGQPWRTCQQVCCQPLLDAYLPCRFTGPLAGSAKSVVALDFMENLIDQNRASNAHFGNIDFRWVLGAGLRRCFRWRLERGSTRRAGALAAALPAAAASPLCSRRASLFRSGHGLLVAAPSPCSCHQQPASHLLAGLPSAC